MNDSDFAASLKSHLRENRRTVEEHPEPESFAEYRSGGLNSDEEQAIREHLVACESCSSLYLGLAELESARPEVLVVSNHELERAWGKLRSRLLSGRSQSRIMMIHRVGWAAAASLALVVAGLGFELRGLRQERQAFFADLPRVIAAERSTRSRTSAIPTLVLEAGRPGMVLLLVDSGLAFDAFRAEFFTGADRRVLRREGLSVSEDLLLVAVASDQLPAGVIRVVVSGLKEGSYEAVEEYDLRVVHR